MTDAVKVGFAAKYRKECQWLESHCMIGITLIILIMRDRSHMQSKWIGITLVNCYLKIAWILYYTTVVYVMYMV